MPSDFPSLFSVDEIEVPSNEVLHESHTSKSKTDKELYDEALSVLGKLYPRIYNNIVETWGSVELREYFNKLLIADREDRQGFPPNICMHIMVLNRIHTDEFNFQNSLIDNWSQSKK